MISLFTCLLRASGDNFIRVFSSHKIYTLNEIGSATIGRHYAYFAIVILYNDNSCVLFGKARGELAETNGYIQRMLTECVRALEARRKEVRLRWEDLLRTERANSPLANPDTLVYLIDDTFDALIDALLKPSVLKRTVHTADFSVVRAKCICGRNPYLAYFTAGEQALLEALVLIQASNGPLDPDVRDSSVQDLYGVIRAAALREIEAFCSLCQYRVDTGRVPGSETLKA